MRKLTLLIALLVGSLSFAHETTYQEKKQMYDSIVYQYEKGNITLETAQTMWSAYINCCREDKNKA